jgi:hypothetical protein
VLIGDACHGTASIPVMYGEHIIPVRWEAPKCRKFIDWPI